MQTECPPLLPLGMTPNEVNAAIDKTAPEIASGLEQWIDVSKQAAGRPNRPGRYAVEVCWEQAGRIACRTYRVRARADEDAARKGRAIAKQQAPSMARIEVVNLQPLWRTNTKKEDL